MNTTYINHQQIVDAYIKFLSEFDDGFFMTINAIDNDKLKFQSQLIKLSLWLNDYCLGASVKRKQKQLNMIAGIEIGYKSEVLHAHIVMTYDPEMRRSYQEINAFIRKKWFALTCAKGSIFSTLLKIEPLDDLRSAVIYSLKDVNVHDQVMPTYMQF